MFSETTCDIQHDLGTFDIHLHAEQFGNFRTERVLELIESYRMNQEEVTTITEQARFVLLGMPLGQIRVNGDVIAHVVASHVIDDVCDSPIIPESIRRDLIHLISFVDLFNTDMTNAVLKMIMSRLEAARLEAGIGATSVVECFNSISIEGNSFESYMQKLSYIKLVIAGLLQVNGIDEHSSSLSEEVILKRKFACAANIISSTDIYDLHRLPPTGCLVATASGLLEMFGAIYPSAASRGVKFESWNQILGTMVHLNNSKHEAQKYFDRANGADFAQLTIDGWTRLKRIYQVNGLDRWDRVELLRFCMGHLLFKGGGHSGHSYSNYPDGMSELIGVYDQIYKEIISNRWVEQQHLAALQQK